MERLGIEAAEAWMAGDDLVWDIQAAQKAGVRAIWVDLERKGLAEDAKILPDRITHSLKELVEVVIENRFLELRRNNTEEWRKDHG